MRSGSALGFAPCLSRGSGLILSAPGSFWALPLLNV